MATLQLTEAELDEQARFAGSGPEIDREHCWPPAGWEIRPVDTWTQRIDKALAELTSKATALAANQAKLDDDLANLAGDMRHLQAVVHKHINGGE